jgi:hypothetical protein
MSSGGKQCRFCRYSGSLYATHQTAGTLREPRTGRIAAEIDVREHGHPLLARYGFHPAEHIGHRSLGSEYLKTFDSEASTHSDLRRVDGCQQNQRAAHAIGTHTAFG